MSPALPIEKLLASVLFPGHMIQNVTNIGNSSISSSTSDVGCPVNYSWCSTTPQLSLGQFIAASFLFPFGHSTVLGILTSLYSKIRGPSAQVSPYCLERRHLLYVTLEHNVGCLLLLGGVRYNRFQKGSQFSV